MWLCDSVETERAVPCSPAQVQASGKKKKELRYRSVISDIFDGSILSLVQCLTCDRVSVLGLPATSTGFVLVDLFLGMVLLFPNPAGCS